MSKGNKRLNPNTTDRDIEMLTMWLRGATYAECGKKFGMSSPGVWAVSKRDNWDKVKEEIRSRKFAEVIDTFKDTISYGLQALKEDMDLMITQAHKRKRVLTKDERMHLRQMIEMLLHETRLEDGKPTEHMTSTVEHTLRLPPGVKHGFIIPPEASMKILPPKEKTQAIDVDVIHERLKEVMNEPVQEAKPPKAKTINQEESTNDTKPKTEKT